jgi:hypothetical protein
MTFRSIRREGRAPSSLLHHLLLAATFLGASASAAAAPAAFVHVDPVTGDLPVSAFTVKRAEKVVPSDSELRACDQVEFVKSQTRIGKIVISTASGGKNAVLDAARNKFTIPCETIVWSAAASDVWKTISSGERLTSVVVGTRGSNFQLPILSSERSNLVAGRRSVYVGWAGGNPPFRVVLTRGNASDVVAELKDVRDNHARLPEVDLKPGQYSLAVVNTPGAGDISVLQEDNLFVVDPAQLPAPPAALKNAKLDKPEADLLYCLYLEGFPDGLWTFEAMQRAADIIDALPGAKEWLRGYSGSR